MVSLPLPFKLSTFTRDNRCSCLPGMDEARNVALCHEDGRAAEQGEDQSDVAFALGTSSGSSCSMESNLSDDASSSPPDHSSKSSSSSSSSTLQLDSEGALYDLSSLLAQLPARRGLSKYYQGKSQSFTSISGATCLEDLGKESTYSKRMKTCKSYAPALGMNQRTNHSPRMRNKMIVKRPSKGSFACLLSRASSTSLFCSGANLVAQQNEEDVQTHLNP